MSTSLRVRIILEVCETVASDLELAVFFSGNYASSTIHNWQVTILSLYIIGEILNGNRNPILRRWLGVMGVSLESVLAYLISRYGLRAEE